MTNPTLNFRLDLDSANDLASFLTEYAQVQRAVRSQEKANRAEVIRNELYEQHAEKLQLLMIIKEKSIECDECGVEKELVEEPMISGFTGHICVNDDCPEDK